MKHLVSVAGSDPFAIDESALVALIHGTAQVVTIRPESTSPEWPSWSSLAQGDAERVG